MKRFLRRLMYKLSDTYHDAIGTLNADLILLDLIARRDRDREAMGRYYTAVRRLESKGEKDSDSWHVANAFLQVFTTEVGNMNGAIVAQKEYVDQQNSLTIKTIRWFRDWVY
jgi:hypothetical protein